MGAKAVCAMLTINVGSRVWQASKVGMLVLCEQSLCRLMGKPSGVPKAKHRDAAHWERIHAWCPGPQGLNGTMRDHACQGCNLSQQLAADATWTVESISIACQGLPLTASVRQAMSTFTWWWLLSRAWPLGFNVPAQGICSSLNATASYSAAGGPYRTRLLP